MRANGSTLCLLLVLAAGCGGHPQPAPETRQLAVSVLEDSGRSVRLRVTPPAPPAEPARAVVWLARVAPRRADLTGIPSPEPEPGPVPEEFAPPPALAADEALKPPLLRSGSVRVPRGARATVELDVRIDEHGEVSDALWAGGASDSNLVAAAIASALEMRFFPALQAGRPVAVWCRQRFDFGAR